MLTLNVRYPESQEKHKKNVEASSLVSDCDRDSRISYLSLQLFFFSPFVDRYDHMWRPQESLMDHQVDSMIFASSFRCLLLCLLFANSQPPNSIYMYLRCHADVQWIILRTFLRL